MSPGAIGRRAPAPRPAAGFSLVEVLVSLIVISVGLLGVAKLEALGLASTGTASVRSIAAIEAASLASAMRANRTYWSVAAPATASITVAGSAVTSADATFTALAATGPSCQVAGTGESACAASAENVAAYDLKQWALALQSALPNSGATVVCATASAPINCTITVTWTEKAVAVNRQGLATAAATALTGTQSYTLYVEP